MTEADTCREFVTPKLVEAGWGVPESVIGEQHSFTNGRIIVAGGKVRRGKQRRADYLLYYRRDAGIPKHRVNWNFLVDLPVGKGKPLDEQVHALATGRCFAQQPERATLALRQLGSTWDFSGRAEALCADDETWLDFAA